jgi:hypothetical protein
VNAFAADLEVISAKYAQIDELEKQIDSVVATAASQWVADRFPDAAELLFDEDTETGRITLMCVVDREGNRHEDASRLSNLLELAGVVGNFTQRAVYNVFKAEGFRQHLIIADHLPGAPA